MNHGSIYHFVWTITIGNLATALQWDKPKSTGQKFNRTPIFLRVKICQLVFRENFHPPKKTVENSKRLQTKATFSRTPQKTILKRFGDFSDSNYLPLGPKAQFGGMSPHVQILRLDEWNSMGKALATTLSDTFFVVKHMHFRVRQVSLLRPACFRRWSTNMARRQVFRFMAERHWWIQWIGLIALLENSLLSWNCGWCVSCRWKSFCCREDTRK